MTNKEIESMVELISIKVAERYLQVIKEHINIQIELHTANCRVQKSSRWAMFLTATLSSIISGTAVALIVVSITT